MTAETLTIRPATADDLPIILGFIKELADYEREPDAVVATEAHLREALFCDQPKVFCVVGFYGSSPAGIAIYFFNFSTWLGCHGLYLEDLYVTPKWRGKGAGKRLLKHLAELAVAEGCGRFEWNVLRWNTPAIDFYESFGAAPQNEWVGYRMEGQTLRDFARSDSE